MPLRDKVELTFPDEAPSSRISLPSASLNAERVSLAPVRYEFATTGKTHYLALHDIVMRDGELWVNEVETIRQTDLRRKITFLPAGVPVAGWADPLDRPNSFVAIHFEAEAIPEPLRDAENFQRPAVYFQDPLLCDTLSRLDRAMTRDEPFVELLSETLCDLAILEFGLLRAKPAAEPRRTPSLSPDQVATVRAFVALNLAKPVSLSDLSRTVGLSKFHFSRAFKAATGRSPYREVLDTRLAVARRLLGEGETASEAAARTGFASPAQLARSLRQHPARSAGDV